MSQAFRMYGVGGRVSSRPSQFCGGIAAALIALALASQSVRGQEAPAIAERIDAVFEILPQNALELAVPLSRRALARRAQAQEALVYSPRPDQAVSAEADEEIAEGDTDFDGTAQEEQLELGTPAARAEPIPEDPDVPRLPRPRPEQRSEVARPAGDAASAAMPAEGRTLELVAAPAGTPDDSAGQPSTSDQTAADEPVFTGSTTARAALDRPTDDCVSVEAVSDVDGDFRRNRAVLGDPRFCIAEQKFKERRRPWTIHTVSSGRRGPLWAVMHDDENIAFDNAVQALATYGGVLVSVEARGKRNQDGIDPNRNFSDAEITCRKLGEAASPRFTGAFRKLLHAHEPMIVLHNNHDGPVPTGGLGHLSMRTVPKSMKIWRSPDGRLASDNALVLFAAKEPVRPEIEAAAEQLNARGLNVVLEPVREDRGDCSLSNYAVLSGQESYLNITVDHDEADMQRRIIDAIMADSAAISAL